MELVWINTALIFNCPRIMEKVQHIYYVNSNFGTMWILNSITVISMKKGHISWNKRTLGKLSHHHKTQIVHSWWLPKDCALAVRAIVMPRTVFLQISPSHISCIINVSFIRLHICFYLINNFIILTIVQRTRDIKKTYVYFYNYTSGREFIEMFTVCRAHLFCPSG